MANMALRGLKTFFGIFRIPLTKFLAGICAVIHGQTCISACANLRDRTPRIGHISVTVKQLKMHLPLCLQFSIMVS
jgi:hypothetical protein